MSKETKTTTYAKIDFSRFNLATFVAMPRAWRAIKDEPRQSCTVLCEASADKSVKYLIPVDQDGQVHWGRRFNAIQTLEVGQQYEIIVQPMEPNPDLTDKQLDEMSSSLEAFDKDKFLKQKADKVQRIDVVQILE